MLLAEFVKAGTKALESLYPQKEARSIVLCFAKRCWERRTIPISLNLNSR